MLGYFVANNKSSKDFNVYLSDADVYGIAEKDIEVVSVRGRNGDLTIDNGRYKNKKFGYPCIIVDNFDENFSGLINYLLSQDGYMRIEDSFHPSQFILARYVGETDPKKVVADGKKGVFELTFDRKPQKFLVEGEYPIVVTSNTSILSSCDQIAKPLIRAYGTGYFSINNIKVTINSANEYTDIDCDLQEAYKDSLATNCNGNITLNNDVFPVLTSGENSIVISGITQLDIVPRWWIL